MVLTEYHFQHHLDKKAWKRLNKLKSLNGVSFPTSLRPGMLEAGATEKCLNGVSFPTSLRPFFFAKN